MKFIIPRLELGELQAEFAGGLLRCGENIAVRKVSSGSKKKSTFGCIPELLESKRSFLMP